MQLENYEPVVGAEEIAEIRALGRHLRGFSVQHINSARVGGGVAEILARLTPMMNDLGIETQWSVISAKPAFFEVTKAIHNALHGARDEVSADMFRLYCAEAMANRDLIDREADVVVLHDPQPLPLLRARRRGKGRAIWRCHVDLSRARIEVWGLLRPLVELCDAAVFHLVDYAKELLIPQFIIPPAIDPLSQKNRELTSEEIQSVLARFSIDPSRPMVLQVSRFDFLKDPLGVIDAYRIARRSVDCQLVLAGGMAADDPEGERVLELARERAQGDPDIHLLNLSPDSHLAINALQRAASVVVQKSLREGFGLVVTEAMWKGKAVIGGAVGGIRNQVIHGLTGFLVNTVEGTAFRIKQLVSNPELANRLGEAGREYVRTNFLLTQYLKSWMVLLLSVQRGRTRGIMELRGPARK